jgi:hypothetical protein
MTDERLLIISGTRIYKGKLNNPSKTVPISTSSTKNPIWTLELRLEMPQNGDIGAAMSCIVCDSTVKFPMDRFATAQ